MTGQMYELVVTAQGEVRDADGNLISSEPIRSTQIITHEQMLEITEGEAQ